jgi:hypothetical protein
MRHCLEETGLLPPLQIVIQQWCRHLRRICASGRSNSRSPLPAQACPLPGMIETSPRILAACARSMACTSACLDRRSHTRIDPSSRPPTTVLASWCTMHVTRVGLEGCSRVASTPPSASTLCRVACRPGKWVRLCRGHVQLLCLRVCRCTRLCSSGQRQAGGGYIFWGTYLVPHQDQI